MRIGASTDSTRLKFVSDAKFDYLEMALWELAGMSDEDFEKCKGDWFAKMKPLRDGANEKIKVGFSEHSDK